MTARRHLRRLLAPGAVALAVSTALPAYAAPIAFYEMPFPCGQTWVASTRSYHSPSANSVDWTRDDDFGMPVVAAAGGRIKVADTVDNSGYGKWVQVDHGNGETTIYAHLDKVTVKVSSGSSLESLTIGMVMVRLVWPLAKLSTPLWAGKSAPAPAVPEAVA